MAVPSRYEKALARNLAELQKALLIRTTILGAEKHRYTLKVFTRVVRESLLSDYRSRAIKVFDQSSKAASFWYLYRTNAKPINAYAKKVGYRMKDLQTVTDKLKIIRNGTQFHIDSVGVLDPKAIWTDANLTGKDLAAAIDFAWGVLSEIQRAAGAEPPSLLDYSVDDALAAFRMVEGKEL